MAIKINGTVIVDNSRNGTLINLTVGGTLSAGGSVGTTGQVLQSTGTGLQWATLSSVATASNLSGGTTASIPYQSAPGATSFLATGTTGQVLLAGASAPTWGSQSALVVGSSTNIVGGSANRIAYQSAVNTTGFIAAPTVASTYLQWNGTGFVWSGAGTNVTIANDTTSNTSRYPLFSDTTSGTATAVYTSSPGYTYKPSTGELSVPVVVASNGVVVNNSVISSDYTVGTGTNGFSVGPITVASGVSMTIADGQKWLVV